MYHSHDEGPRAQARRMIDINRVHSGEIGRARVIRQAAGLLARNAMAIARLDEPLRRKPSYLADLLRMVWFYVVDFDRSGTRRNGAVRTSPAPAARASRRASASALGGSGRGRDGRGRRRAGGEAARAPRAASSGTRQAARPRTRPTPTADADEQAQRWSHAGVHQRDPDREHARAHAERGLEGARDARGRRPSARRRGSARRGPSGPARSASSRSRSRPRRRRRPTAGPTLNAIRWHVVSTMREAEHRPRAVARHQHVHVERLQRLHDADPREHLDDRHRVRPLLAEHERHEVGRHDDEAGRARARRRRRSAGRRAPTWRRSARARPGSARTPARRRAAAARRACSRARGSCCRRRRRCRARRCRGSGRSGSGRRSPAGSRASAGRACRR